MESYHVKVCSFQMQGIQNHLALPNFQELPCKLKTWFLDINTVVGSHPDSGPFFTGFLAAAVHTDNLMMGYQCSVGGVLHYSGLVQLCGGEVSEVGVQGFLHIQAQ